MSFSYLFPYFSDFDSAYAMVRSRMLHWTPSDGMDRDDRTPVEFLTRLYDALPGKDRKVLVEACLKALLDPESKVRSGAIMFFEFLYNIDVSDALIDVITNHGELFEGIPNPWRENEGNLYGDLAFVISQRAKKGDQRVIQFLRKEALKPGKAIHVITALIRANKQWVLSNVEDIIRNSPDALGPLLWNIRDDPANVLTIVRKILNVLPIDEVKKYIMSELTGALRDRALDICDLKEQEQRSQ